MWKVQLAKVFITLKNVLLDVFKKKKKLFWEWKIFIFKILLHKVWKNNGLKIRHMTTDVSISSKMQKLCSERFTA